MCSYTHIADVLLVAVIAVTSGAVVAGLVATSRRAGFSTAFARRLGVGLSLAIAGWLAATTLIARAGVLRVFDSLPPRLPLLAAFVLVVTVTLTSTATFRRMLVALPPTWPIALQTFRIGVELVLYLLFQDGLVPAQVTFEGHNFDVLVGLTAPLVALAASKRWGGRALVVLWNVGGLLSLVNVVSAVVRALPGRLPVELGAVAPIVLTTAPFVWIPALAVPLAVLGHVLSLRQTLAPAPEEIA